MRQFQNLTIIGTSHIAQQSVQEVSQAVEQIKPQIIALELDKTRFYALTQKQKRKIRFTDVIRIGFKGYLFALILFFAKEN
jgi:pheromone shutdown protein TraB